MNLIHPQTQHLSGNAAQVNMTLVSCHGHVLVRENEDFRLKNFHDLAAEEIAIFNGTRLSLSGQIFTVSPLNQASQTEHHVVLNQGDLFAMCAPDGKLSRLTPKVREWEIFCRVPTKTIRLLRWINSKYWCDEAGYSFVPAGSVSIVRGRVFLGQYVLPITQIYDRVKNDTITLESRDHPTLQYSVVLKAKNPDLAPEHPVIWLKSRGGPANRALSYLVAHKIKSLSPRTQIQNINLPEWGWDHRGFPAPVVERSCKLGAFRFWLDVHGLADCLSRGEIDCLEHDAFAFNVDFLPSRDEARNILNSIKTPQKMVGLGSKYLLCNIRAGEILHGKHRPYMPLPPTYFQKLVSDSGCSPVFMGQLEDNPYMEDLRRSFPNAAYLTGQSVEEDFAMLQDSKNVALSISTFSWLAAWLGHAERIYLPMGGIFHPNFQRQQNFVVTGDPAYRYVLLPLCGAVSLFDQPEAFFAQQDMIGRDARLISTQETEDILERSKATWPREPRLSGFDRDFYTTRYQEVQPMIESGIVSSAVEHYLHHGFKRRYLPFDFDEETYLLAHPEARMALAEAQYFDALEYAQAHFDTYKNPKMDCRK